MFDFLKNNHPNLFKIWTLTLLGLSCYLYSIFSRNFAEWYIQIPKLDFPIFIGEIVLFTSSVLIITANYRTLLPKLPKWLWLLLAYGLWLLTKTILGYCYGGPLALRTAALFYYPLFALIGYWVFDTKFFQGKTLIVLFTILVGSLLLNKVDLYYIFTYGMLVLAMSIGIKNKWFKILGFATIAFQFFFLQVFWANSRSHMVGITLGSFFLLCYFLYLKANVTSKIRIGIATISIGIFILCAIQFSDPNAIKPTLAIENIQYSFQQLDLYISGKKATFVPFKLKSKVYNKNRYNPLYGKTNEQPHSQSTFNSDVGTYSDLNVYNVAMTDSNLSPINTPITTTQIIAPTQRSESLIQNPFPAEQQKSYRSSEVATNNILFRLFIWRDMLVDLNTHHAWFWGMNFGHPQRSISLEILDWATVEWKRDGWITPHNSFFHYIYRGGIVGMILILGFLTLLWHMTIRFIKLKSLWGGCLLASVIYWICVANFLVILELPYNAIPFWSLLGMTFAYLHHLERHQESK
ncbi:MAG: O-antigen ligase family protein [Candidatus Omnitrophica bacterium]|nr:O-antigen ligase family protein [Candidatus Omnitrophota bacterium]